MTAEPTDTQVDLDLQTLEIPNYKVRLPDGSIRHFEPMDLVFQLEQLKTIKSPSEVCQVLSMVLNTEFTIIQAMKFLEYFRTWAIKNLDPILKNEFGRELFSSTSIPEETTIDSLQLPDAPLT